MISPRFARVSIASLFALGALGASSTARAQAQSMTCTQDSDCTKGFTCQTVGASACPAIACASGTACTQPVCNPQVIKECQPGPCNTDVDCATGMVCYTDSVESCPAVGAPACPPNADCAVPAFDAGACTTVSSKSCVPQYDVPCKVDSDCGSGFTCVPDTVSACSGSGSASAGSSTTGPSTSPSTLPTAVTYDGGATPPPTCTTTTLSTSSCQLNAIPCTTNAQCPSTAWTCAASVSVSNGCATPAILVDGDGGGATSTSCDPAAPLPPQCVPPYAYLTGVGGGSALSSAPRAAGGGVTNGAASTGSAANSGAPASNPASRPTVTAGCQMSPVNAGGDGASFLALLGLVGLVRRRNR